MKKELKNIPGLEPEQTVVIWDMNFGFKSDFQGEVSDISFSDDGKGKASGTAKMNVGKLRIMTLLYGILEAPSLGINLPKDLKMGFSLEEKENRLRAVRCLEKDTGLYIYNEIQNISKDDEDIETIKKN